MDEATIPLLLLLVGFAAMLWHAVREDRRGGGSLPPQGAASATATAEQED